VTQDALPECGETGERLSEKKVLGAE
jgi:hypothetical protein